MDRNIINKSNFRHRSEVALRKESVDRNNPLETFIILAKQSLSARRAWIEICPTCQWRRSVKLSLSARRAWIEIIYPVRGRHLNWVALRKESVDRNA